MSDNIFREKSLKRISSPESLNDYVKVANPGVWVLLVAVIILLLGFLAWGTYGRIDSKIETIGVVQNGVLTSFVREDDVEVIKDTSIINIDGDEFVINSADDTPSKFSTTGVDSSDINDSYMHIANLTKDSWVYRLYCNVSLPNGVYKVSVITERVKPISLLFN